MIWLAALATAGGLGVMWYALSPALGGSRQVSALEDRMSFYGSPELRAVEDDIERLSFSQRVLDPIRLAINNQVLRLTPAQYHDGLQRSLDAAGRPYNLTPSSFLLVRVLFTVVAGALGVAIGIFALSALVGIIAVVVCAVAAWAAVGLWLRGEVQARRRKTLHALPDVVDFLVVAVDAGLNFDLALNRVVEKFHNPLTAGMATALSEVQLGRYRLEALEDFARRSDVPEVANFIQTVVGSERMGVPIARTLRIQAADLRWRRGEWARERASRAAIRMTLPMVGLIFPTLWLILLGPSFLALLQRGL